MGITQTMFSSSIQLRLKLNQKMIKITLYIQKFKSTFLSNSQVKEEIIEIRNALNLPKLTPGVKTQIDL